MPLLDLCLIRPRARAGRPPVQLGVPLLDEYLRLLCGRCRPNTVLAAAYDLKVFFTVVGKEPSQVRPADDWSGVSLRTVRRRLSSVSGLYAFLHARGDVPTNRDHFAQPSRKPCR